MPILEGDIKLNQSQRMTDNDDGGGRITGVEIVDGVSNAIFDDVSDLDRTTGNVALRKVYPNVQTADTDTYLGANVIIAEQPNDPSVSVTLFTTNDFDDLRTDARENIERYVVKGSKADWDLLGYHYVNQQIILGIQRTDRPVPAVGDVFVLENDNTSQIQYVKVTEVAAQNIIYEAIVNGQYTEFERTRLDMEISAPLEYEFPGGDPYIVGTIMPAGDPNLASLVNVTEVADAARYLGIKATTAPQVLNDLEVTVEDIYTSLVPAAQSETPIVDADLYPTDTNVEAAMDGAAFVSNDNFELTYLSSNTVQGYLLRSAVRGTATITINGSTFVDQNDGNLIRSGGSSSFSTLQIEYDTGRISGTRDSGSGSGVITGGTATYRSGAPFSGKRVSDFTEITLNNRGYNYTETWPNEKPKPGSMFVSYMVLGQWYTLRDNGSGQLEGDGTGSINFTTGTVAITLEALPDVDTDIIWSYVVDIALEVDEISGASLEPVSVEINIANEGIEPGTVVVTWTADSIVRTADDSVTTGVLAGDGTGTVDYASGVVTITPDILADDGETMDVTYQWQTNHTEFDGSPSVDGASVYTYTIAGTKPIKPGTVTLDYLVQRQYRSYNYTYQVKRRDDGAGGWFGALGTVDYTTGVINMTALITYNIYTYYWSSYNYFTQTVTRSTFQRTYGRTEAIQGGVTIKWVDTGATPAGSAQSETLTQVQFKLVDKDAALIAESLRFTMGNKTYYDRDGIVYTDFATATGAGTQVGTVDYNSAIVTLDAWPKGVSSAVTIIAGAYTTGDLGVSEVAFRTPTSPIRAQSMQLTIIDEDGNILTNTVGVDGTFDGTNNIYGTVNVNTGVTRAYFGDGVDTAIECLADTGRYNAIAIVSLPLDESLLGLNPVRLPSDGRVPIYRAGDVVVVHNTEEANFSNPANPLDVLPTRVRLSYARVEDANGLELTDSMWSVDLDTGDFTLDATFDATGFVEPFKAVHRVEDMNLVSSVDISGKLGLTSPLSHTFPSGTTYVSTALVIGDMQARVTNLFDQETWTEVWSDLIIGGEPAAEYNDAAYPIVVTNAGSLQQRWALVFTSGTSFNIIGETVGLIGTGTVNADIFPNNPNTGVPYFTLDYRGWGAGWGAGNVLRFNTVGAAYPVWIARTVLQSEPTVQSDTFRIQIRGNVNA